MIQVITATGNWKSLKCKGQRRLPLGRDLWLRAESGERWGGTWGGMEEEPSEQW